VGRVAHPIGDSGSGSGRGKGKKGGSGWGVQALLPLQALTTNDPAAHRDD